ncbi:hypothetical protein Tco_0398085 [Tanacetum coccineum]
MSSSSSSSSSSSDDDSHLKKQKNPFESLDMDAYLGKNLKDEMIEKLCEDIKADHKLSKSILKQYSKIQKRLKNKMKLLQEKLV